MVDPVFRGPVTSAAPRRATDVVITDETGIPLARRFDDALHPGTSRRRGSVLDWSVSPGERTVAGDRLLADDVDLTHVRAVFRLSGHNARAVLQRLCALDLSDDMFPPGAAGRTGVAGVATEIVRDDRNGTRSYLLLPSRSFGGYLWDVMVDASTEFATPPTRR